jgi:hypothetical protein
MFEEYKKDLLKFYRIRKENHRLSVNLEEPGREKLRKECLDVFKRKNTPRDKDFIRSVFDPTDEYEDQVRSIEKFNLDRFRPLINFLKEEVKIIRDDKLIKLLAWLLDFPTYGDWRELSEEGLKLIFDNAATGNNSTPPIIIFPPDEPPLPPDNPPTTPPPLENISFPRFSPRQIIIACTLLLSICSISFMIWERMVTSIRMPKADEKFMYWDGDHYEPVKAGEQEPGVTIIPLDLKKLNQQRKINLPDTMTKYSLGKVWYKGRGKGHEFFTDSGIYPPDTSRRLLPLSSTILRYSSYDRYLLTRLKWFLCAAFLISIGGYLVSRMKRKVNVKKDVQAIDNHVAIFPEAELAQ